MTTLPGCVASYQHLSDPRVANDGFDFLCGGVKHDVGARVRIRADVCKNVAPRGGEKIHASLEYHFGVIN